MLVLNCGGKGWQGEKDFGEDSEVGQSCRVPAEEGGWKGKVGDENEFECK